LKKYIIGQLKKFSCIPGKEKTWISNLTDEQLFDVYLKIRNGDSSRSIAIYIQNTLQIQTNSSIHSMAQGITTFKKRIVHLLIQMPEQSETSEKPIGIDDTDALKKIEIMAERYEARIKKIMEEESQTGIRYPYLNRDIQSLAALRRAIIRYREWEIKYAEPLRELMEKKKNIERDRKFNIFMNNLGDDGQQRVVQALDKFLDLASQSAIKMVFDEKLRKFVPVETGCKARQNDKH